MLLPSNCVGEVLYLITERCNFRCKSCFSLQSCKEEEEIACVNLLEQFKKSILLKNVKTVAISGGEPFLKRDIDIFICGLLSIGIKVSITTNGYYTEKIKDLIERINRKDKISFIVSIDGIGDTHNKIRGNKDAFKHAINTINMLEEQGVNVSVNTVIQKDNIDEMILFNDTMKKNQIPVNFIPEVNYHGGENNYQNLNYLQKVYPFIHSQIDKKYVLSEGSFKINYCHAGFNNCVIGPNGDLAVCAAGYQTPFHKRKAFVFGNLKESDFDTIFLSRNRLEVCDNVVRKCSGCYGGCEVNREYNYFDLPINFDEKEINNLKLIIENSKTDSYSYFEGWNEIEKYKWGNLCWMGSKKSKMLHKIMFDGVKKININYLNNLPKEAKSTPMALNFTLDGKTMLKGFVLGKGGTIEVLLDNKYHKNDILELVFEVNHLWRPIDINGGTDNRELGIAICSVETY